LEDVILLKLNKKESNSEIIKEKFGMPIGFPMFYLINPDGTLKAAWAGYSKEYFLGKMESLFPD
tara:strand:+ start:225 stop:416 length:192 start_codon:yes stop_codon:yes gene_type:complete